MKMSYIHSLSLLCLLLLPGISTAADIVPPEIQLPGTQPREVSNFEAPNKCDNCHAGYNDADTVGEPQHEPATGWRGAAMGNAGRDPIFWATMAIAEQGFDGAGDLCIRCHSTGGWYGGRSTPTDASGLAASDDDGVDCDTCHSMTNPDDLELLGVMNSPFVANCNGDPANLDDPKCSSGEGFYGSGMTSMWANGDKLGPYTEEDASARHQAMKSKFHRSVDFCGSCHDVSNSAVGDLAPGNGTQPGNPHSVASSWDLGLTTVFKGSTVNIPELGGPVENKAAFNNPPYAYGIVERTFSEYKSSAFPTMRVGEFTSLPDGTDPNLPSLQVPGGSLYVTYQAALAADPIPSPDGIPGDYADGDPRFFSCQSCHMRPAVSAGANKRGVKIRKDLPQHDHTGGNYWLADMIKYQDSKGQLRLGGGLSSTQITAIDYGQLRAVGHLQQAASLLVEGNNLKVVNLTGHKLISGYPEGRRMWLNIKWFDANGALMDREDGAYGPLFDGNGAPVMVANPADETGQTLVQVESILNLDDTNTRIYEAHYSMTKEWAEILLITGKPRNFVLSYDRNTGAVDYTLGNLADQAASTEEAVSFHETFHFALNNHVAEDNRIPPYGMSYDEAQKRNALPVPANQYGVDIDLNADVRTYNYWDLLDLNALKPTDAVFAEIDLLYQGTSWEYIQFLYKANDGTNAFLGQEGVNMLEAWINAEVPVAMEVGGDRKMVPPVVMASITWGTPPGNSVPTCSIDTPAGDTTIIKGGSISYAGTATDSDGTIASYSWTFPGGSPASSTAEVPVSVSYSTSGIYETIFTATDDRGASCANATVTITVEESGGTTACSDYQDRAACNGDASCKWSGKNKICQDR